MAQDRRTRKPGLYFLETAAYYGVTGLLRLIPARRRGDFCGAVAKWAGRRLKKLNRRILDNLDRGMPGLDAHQKRDIAARVWDNLGRTYGEFSLGEDLINPQTGPDRTGVVRMGVVRIRNLAEFERIRAEGRGAVLVGGHFSNWELSSLVFGRLSDQFHAFYRRPDNHVLEKAVLRMRAVTGTGLIDRNDRGGLKKALKILKNGGQVGILVDQRIHTADEIPFMGHPAKTISLPYALARSSGAAILPFRMLRQPDGSYEGIFDAEIKLPPQSASETPGSENTVSENSGSENTGSGDSSRKHAQAAVLGEVNALIGEWIRRDPGQWLWLHNRWG